MNIPHSTFHPKRIYPHANFGAVSLFKILSLKIVMLFKKLIPAKNDGETKKPRQSWCVGFTLVEMIVSIGLFTIVLFIASSAFLAVLNADRKSRSTRVAMDGLNLSLEGMARRIKTGSTYYCGGTIASVGTMDCLSGGTSITFTEQDGVTRTAYRFDGTTKTIMRQVGSGSESAVTSPEITINKLTFIVGGSSVNDALQPHITIFIDGTTTRGKVSSNFKIQTTITERAYDI